MDAHYDIMARRCGQCLTTSQRIVPGARAAQIVRDCRAGDHKFVCHKAQMAGLENVACRGVHDAVGPCRAYRFACALGIPVVEHDPDTLPGARP